MELVVRFSIQKKRRRREPGSTASAGEAPDWPKTRLVGIPANHSTPRHAPDIIVEGTEHLPVLPAGAHLEAGGVYLDLSGHATVPFRALPGQTAGHGNLYVAQKDIPAELWQSLVRAMVRAQDAIASRESGETPGTPRIVIQPRGQRKAPSPGANPAEQAA